MTHQDDLLTSVETAALLGIKNNTLEIWRGRGHGPAFIKLGTSPQAAVRYRRAEVLRWIEQRIYASTSALMSFFKDFFSPLGTPERFLHCWLPKEGTRSEDVGEQALMRGLDTA